MNILNDKFEDHFWSESDKGQFMKDDHDQVKQDQVKHVHAKSHKLESKPIVTESESLVKEEEIVKIAPVLNRKAADSKFDRQESQPQKDSPIQPCNSVSRTDLSNSMFLIAIVSTILSKSLYSLI